jgi:hypothetical protein
MGAPHGTGNFITEQMAQQLRLSSCMILQGKSLPSSYDLLAY